jgi:rRNA-processing protein FCF1
MVLEGAAKAAAARMPDAPNVRVVQAPGSGDDAIVAVVRELGGHCCVITADRGLRARCAAAGATILGPGWLLGQLRS